MEITPQIDKLIRSKNIDDQRIGLELLKAIGFNDMDEIRYQYRYLLSDILIEFFEYDLSLSHNLPAIYQGREAQTSVKLLKWK